MSKLQECEEGMVLISQEYVRKRVASVDFGNNSFDPSEEIKFLVGAIVRNSTVPLASVQYLIRGFDGVYGSRLDMDKRVFLDLTEPEEIQRKEQFLSATSTVIHILRTRL